MRNSASTTTTRVYFDADVLLNGFMGGLTPVAMGPDSVREADFADEGLLVWIGEDASVSAPIEAAGRMTALARGAGWHARCGHTPEQFGLVVEAFSPDHLDARATWALVRETVGLTEQE